MSASKRRLEQPDRETVRDAGQITTSNEPPDPEVKEEFGDLQRQVRSGSRPLAEERSPGARDGDLDAAWDGSDVDDDGGDGSAPTPDQNAVDDLGEEVGLTFRDNESVDGPGKVARRDRERWELEPASSEDYSERQSESPDTPKTPEAGSQTPPEPTRGPSAVQAHRGKRG